jgi:serine/threonine protein kinase/tetratricopeptide (TPR) repeat protein
VALTLGDFQLGARLGQGGMGEVWQSLHLPTGTPAAIKVLRRGDPALVRAMQAEIRAVAALDHPHVIAILDHGVSPETAGNLPWFAMELCTRGDLARHARALSWSLVRRLLDELLDALSHAHARGVIHRDIKPENVLLAGATDPRPGWRLTDFGIAFAADDASAAALEAPRGSPRFMAPEQFGGYRRDLGPWTDLYGLGCLAWTVLCGEPPFSGSLARLARAHAEEALPAFSPDRPVPAALEGWLRLLLAKRPDRRFACAADAADALAALDRTGTDRAVASRSATKSEGENSTFVVSLARVPVGVVPPGADDDLPPLPPPPAFPPSWRDDAAVAPRPALAARSTALFGVRRPPLVGREAERDRIWNTLGAVHRDRRLRILVLEAPLGTGCSRLAEWAVHRARESGAAWAFRAGHGPWGEGGPGEIVKEIFHLHGLVNESLRGRLLWLVSQGTLSPSQVEVVEDWVQSGSPRTTSAQRLATLADILSRLAADRPLVLWLDDLHWGRDARALVEVLRARGDVPALILGTSVPSALADDPRGPAEVLSLLGDLNGKISLSPLDTAGSRALARATLDLEDHLAASIEAKAAGHPLLLISLLESWLLSGSLEPGPHGFRLRNFAPVGLPADLRTAVDALIEQALAGRRADDGWALEVAGALGESFEIRGWARACMLAGVAPSADLVPHLFAEGLWRPAEDVGGDPYFASPVFHAAVKDRARRSGYEARWHRACAAWLTETRGAPERIGRHLLRAGEALSAVAPLLDATEAALEAADLGTAGRWLARLDDAVRASGVQDQPPGIRARLARATLLVLRGTAAGAEGADHEIEAVIEASGGLPRVAARAWMLKGRRLTRKRRFDAAFDALDRAAAHAGADAALRAQTEVHRGNLLLHLGRIDEAEEALRRARPGANALPSEMGRLCLAAGRVARSRGDLEVAESRAREAIRWFESAGSGWGRLAGQDLVADLAADRGEWSAAEAGYRETERGYLALGLRQSEVSRLHLAWVALRAGRYAEARATFDHAIGVFGAWGAPVYQDLAWAGRLAADAAAGDGGAVDEALEALGRARAAGLTQAVRSCIRLARGLAAEYLDPRRAAAIAALEGE